MPLLTTFSNSSSKRFGLTAVRKVRPGQQAFTTPGTYTWIAPQGVTSISVVVIGGGGNGPYGPTIGNYEAGGSSVDYGGSGGGGAGGLAYASVPVTPGSSYTVVVGAGSTNNSTGGSGGLSSFNNVIIAYGGGAGVPAGSGGGGGQGSLGGYPGAWYSGGNGGPYSSPSVWGGGGGGAAGYTGNGGNGSSTEFGNLGVNDGATGGRADRDAPHPGGGQSILGLNGANKIYGFGGGGGGVDRNGDAGGSGAVRIIWGEGRAYPSTNTLDIL